MRNNESKMRLMDRCHRERALSQGDSVRLLTAAGFIAASVLILWAAFAFVCSRRQPSVITAEVSSSETSPSSGTVTPSEVSSDTAAVPDDAALVRVREYIPDIEVALAYATENNFTGKVIYEFDDAWLRYGTVRKLAEAQQELKKQGARLKIWDAFRPVSAQFRLWAICPDPKYVSNPKKGYSSHSRGNTVDVTLIDGEGNELVMPTGFDDFTPLADRDYSDVKNKAAVSNVRLLEKTMSACGFKPYFGEWWHFSDTDRYEVAKEYIPG